MSSLKTLVFKIDPKRPDKKIVSKSAKAVRAGRLVVFPTETVYGIAANMLKKKTIYRLYRIKKRPDNKPFTVHISSPGMIKKMRCDITKEARMLMKKFWPGPLTIILRSIDDRKIGFRMPANKVAHELISKAAVPVVAPSANISGKKPPRNAWRVIESLDGKIDIILDAGKTSIGIESTVVDATSSPVKILRDGAIKREDIFMVLRSVHG